ncbi:MAG TPA: M48 family metalloprotease [Candidatus Acidoferrales bacterium]|nr:M48 family metalloprotease [Candidatus Acidoferrales bacterium]
MSKLVMALCACAVSFYLMSTLFVKRDNAYLREGAGSFYPLVTVLQRGDKLEQIETDGNWYKVRTQNQQEGWIAANCLADKQPEGEVVEKISKSWSSAKASQSGLAAAIKGFAKKYGKANPGNVDDVYEHLQKNFTGSDVARFNMPLADYHSRNRGRLDIDDLDLDQPEYDPSFEEQGIGVGIAARLISKGIVTDPELVRYVNLIAAVVAQNSKVYDWDFTVFILNDPTINGFACPGGYVFVTLGAVKACEDESMLAAIIAHEMAHVIRRHGLQEMTKRLVDIKADQAYNELEEETGESDVDSELESMAESSYDIVVHKRLMDYETEADKISAILCANAGYDPTGIVRMDAKVASMADTNPDIFGDDFSLQNNPAERYNSIKKFVDNKFTGTDPGAQMKDRFESEIRK